MPVAPRWGLRGACGSEMGGYRGPCGSCGCLQLQNGRPRGVCSSCGCLWLRNGGLMGACGSKMGVLGIPVAPMDVCSSEMGSQGSLRLPCGCLWLQNGGPTGPCDPKMGIPQDPFRFKIWKSHRSFWLQNGSLQVWHPQALIQGDNMGVPQVPVTPKWVSQESFYPQNGDPTGPHGSGTRKPYTG